MAKYHDNDHLPSHRATPVRANKGIRQTIDDYLASAHSKVEGFKGEQVEGAIQRFVRTSFERMGRAPWNLTGKELESLLTEFLPPSFEGNEPYLDGAITVFQSLFEQLDSQRNVEHKSDLDKVFLRLKETFPKTVKELPEDKRVPWVETVETLVTKEPKPKRNDPCSCGSGKKFKACCGKA